MQLGLSQQRSSAGAGGVPPARQGSQPDFSFFGSYQQQVGAMMLHLQCVCVDLPQGSQAAALCRSVEADTWLLPQNLA